MSARRKQNRWEIARQHGQMLLPIFQQAITLSVRLRVYWESAVNQEGYGSIEDAILGIYRETGSTEETAQRLGFDRRCISRKLAALLEPTRGPGGANNPYGRSGKPKHKSVQI